MSSCFWIFSSLNTRGILTRFPNDSSKHSGSLIPSLRKNTYGITSILPNRNISIWMACLPAEILETHQHITNPSNVFIPQSRKLLKRSSKSSPPMQQPQPHNQLERNHPLLHWNVRAPLQIPKFLTSPENHLHHVSRCFHLPHQHPSNRLNKHTCLYSLSPPYFREQLESYWASSHKELERWLFASPSKDIAIILLYIFLILLFCSHCIYILPRHWPTKKSYVLGFLKLY